MAEAEGKEPKEVAAPSDEVEEKKPSLSSPTPIFGAGFSTSTGFGGFTGVSQPSAATDAEDDEDKAPEEECKAEFKPIVQLQEVEANTGEENEECLLEIKSKLYRYEKDNNEWKERGIGQAKFLQNKESKKIRFLMRQEKTLKIRANHIAMPGTKLSMHGGNDKAWVWTAMDFADEEQKVEMFCIRFGSAERANEFKEQYEKSMEHNKTLLEAAGTSTDDTEAAGDEDKAKANDDTAAAVDEVAESLEKATV